MREKWVKIADKITEYCLYGVVFFFPISIALVESIFSLGVLFFVIKKILRADFKFLKSLPCLFLLFFLFFISLSTVNSGVYLKKSLIALFFKWFEYILIFLVAKDTLTNRARIRNAVVILLIFSVITGIDGLSQKLFGFEFIRNRSLGVTDSGLTSITGPFRHYNDFSVYLIIALALFMAILLSGKLRGVFRVSVYLIAGLLIGCLLLTYSRGGWLGFIFASLTLIILSRKFKLLILLAIFVLTLIFAPVIKQKNIFSFDIETSQIMTENSSTRSIVWHDADRFRVWGTAFRMVKENPFLGKGLGTFMDYFARYEPLLIVQYAHNCFLQLWAEAGIFSLISFLLFVSSLLWRGIRKFRQNKDFILLGLICGMVGFLVHSFFDTDLYSLQISVLFWLILGLIAAKNDIKLSVP